MDKFMKFEIANGLAGGSASAGAGVAMGAGVGIMAPAMLQRVFSPDQVELKREPVSTRQVAMMVREPPSSRLRAAPKKCLGGYNAEGSIPPERVRPEGLTTRL